MTPFQVVVDYLRRYKGKYSLSALRDQLRKENVAPEVIEEAARLALADAPAPARPPVSAYPLLDGVPAWLISLPNPENYRAIQKAIEFRSCLMPQAAVLLGALHITKPPALDLWACQAFDLSNGEAKEYLGTLAEGGRMMVVFSDPKDEIRIKARVDVDRAHLSTLMARGLSYNGALPRPDGGQALERFLQAFAPAFRMKGFEGAWAVAEQAAVPGKDASGVVWTQDSFGAGGLNGYIHSSTPAGDAAARPADGTAPGEVGDIPLEDDEKGERLLAELDATLYRSNPFRLLELPVDASPREINKRRQILAMAAQTGSAPPPGPYRALPSGAAPDEGVLRDALARLEEPPQRLVQEFFWFWPPPPGSEEDAAKAALAKDDIPSALAAWARREQAAKGETAAHNLAVLYHALALEAEPGHGPAPAAGTRPDPAACWKEAFRRWRELARQGRLWQRLAQRIHAINDPRLKPGRAAQLRRELPGALLSINARLALEAFENGRRPDAERHLGHIRDSGFPSAAIDEALRVVAARLPERIAGFIKLAHDEVDKDPAQGDAVAERLMDQAEPLLQTINAILPGGTVRDAAYNNVAVGAAAAVVAFDKVRPLNSKRCLDLSLRALALSTHEETRRVIENNIALFKKEIEEALPPAAAALQEQLAGFCQRAHDEVAKDSSQGDAAAGKLMDQAEPLLQALDAVLPGGPARHSLHDKVAREAWQAVVLYDRVKPGQGEKCLDLLLRSLELSSGGEMAGQLEKDIAAFKTEVEDAEKIKTCWFCGSDGGQRASSPLIPIHKVKGKVEKDSKWYTQYTWREIPVPRCPECAAFHQSGGGRGAWAPKLPAALANAGILLGALCAAAMSAKAFGDAQYWVPTLLFGGILLPLVLFVDPLRRPIWAVFSPWARSVAMTIQGWLKRRITTAWTAELERQWNFPPLVTAFAEGWKIGREPPD